MIRYFIYLLCAFLMLGTLEVSAQKKEQKKSKYKNRNASGQKISKSKNGKNTQAGQSAALRNAYQDMTGRYNGYYNAKLILTESILKLTDNHKDDYAELLDVFPYEGGDKAASVHSQMDQVIEKASIDIKLHPNSKWLDDCYLLIGQANFFKGDYDKALESFQYVNRQFGDRIRISEKRAREKGLRERSLPSVGGNASVGVGGKGVDAKQIKEKLQKELQKERETQQKEKAADRKDSLKEKEKAKKEREKAIKDRNAEKAKESERRKKENDKLKKLKGEKRKSYMAEIKARRASYDAQKLAEKEEAEAKKLAAQEEKEAEKAEKEALAAQEAEEEQKKKEEAEKEAAKSDEEVLFAEEGNKKTVDAHNTFDSYKPKKGISHKPAKYEALVWLAKTYLEMDAQSEALAVLQKATNEKKMTRKQRAAIYALYSQYHLQNEDNQQAQIALSQAIENTRGKRNKARFHFVKAQLAMEDATYEPAITSFRKVIKSKPLRYDMEFNARLNIARAQVLAGDFDAKDAERYFEKMLKDDKNDDYEDQIYFAMSEMAIENGDMDKALELLAKSAATSTVNNEQKALTYLKVAELYYNKENYLQSSYYYDSTALFLPNDYPERESILERREVLTELAKYVNLVETEDSLQMIAAMNEGKRNRFLDDLIADLEQQAIGEQEIKEEPKNTTTSTPDASTWYFYNETAKSIGYNEFQGQWGGRPLQDDWRRNTTQTGFTDVASIQTSDEQTSALLALMESGQLTREYFLNKLPLTPDAVQGSNNKIAYALFQIGNIYKDNLKSPEQALESYEDLLRRFPKSEYATQTHYTLFLLKTEMGDVAGANVHKNHILNNDPNSLFAKMLENPEYAELAQNQNMMQKAYYEETYQTYLSGNFDKVAERSANAEKQFSPNIHAGQYALLSAMSVGETKEKTQYITALKGVVLNYPEDPVKEKAEEILSYLQASTKKESKKSIYTHEPKSSHYFVVAFDRFVESLNKTINKVDDYNTANHKLDELKVTQMLLNQQNQIILVKTFGSQEEAMAYYNKFANVHTALLEKVDSGIDIKFFPISKRNFTQYFKSKDVDLYYEFFEDNYLD